MSISVRREKIIVIDKINTVGFYNLRYRALTDPKDITNMHCVWKIA